MNVYHLFFSIVIKINKNCIFADFVASYRGTKLRKHKAWLLSEIQEPPWTSENKMDEQLMCDYGDPQSVSGHFKLSSPLLVNDFDFNVRNICRYLSAGWHCSPRVSHEWRHTCKQFQNPVGCGILWPLLGDFLSKTYAKSTCDLHRS